MQTAAPTAPAEPVAAETLVPAAEETELRVTENVSLDDAQPHGEETQAETPPPKRRPSRHDDQMAAIVAKRRERLDAERAEGMAQGFADQEPLAAAAPSDPTPEKAEALPSAPSAPPAPDAPAAPVRTHKIVVRGRDIEMSEDDLRRAAELGVEYGARMREAQAAATQPIPSAGPSPPAAPPSPSPQAPSDEDRDAMRELAREILYGDEEKVADALLRARQPQHQQQPVDRDELVREIYARFDARLGLQNALQTFGSEYPEIVNDPDLATLAANYVPQLRDHYAQTGTRRSELDLFREAGNAVRQRLQGWSSASRPAPAPEPAHPAPPSGPSRTLIKRSTPQAPAAAAAQAVTTPPRQKTASDIVNDMKRARGQPVHA